MTRDVGLRRQAVRLSIDRDPELRDQIDVFRADVDLARQFISESIEDLARVGTLLADDTRTEEEVENLFCPFHTLKGSAGQLGLMSIQAVAHAAETVLEQARKVSMGPAECGILSRTVDVLTVILRALDASLEGEPLMDYEPAVTALLELLAEHAGPARAAAAEPPVLTMPVKGHDPILSTRVDRRLLAGLADAAGELAVAHARMEAHRAGALDAVGSYTRAQADARRALATLQQVVLEIRLTTVGQAFGALARAARDLGIKAGKPLIVIVDGDETLLDRAVVDELTGPLLQLVRNSVVHGLESPEIRVPAGKPAEGRITLRARVNANGVTLSVSDDGRGLDTERIRNRAIELGILRPDESISSAALHALIFRPGFSTSERVTELSGRGVGMDVVRRQVEGLGGLVEITTTPGGGTTFTLRLPPQIAVLDAFVASTAIGPLLVPSPLVRECLQGEGDGMERESPISARFHGRTGVRAAVDYRSGSVEEFRSTAGTVLLLGDEAEQIAMAVDRVSSPERVI